ncbi:MAG TPA: VWA domain-containing protein, partial [Longimicrobiales bacterium]|nr:VWA domain-containing protein [Longimicrobiales bacterium]
TDAADETPTRTRPDDPPGGKAFLENLVAFGGALRAAGIAVTPMQIADTVRALSWVRLEDRDEVLRATRATLVTRREDLALFETVFNRFWRLPHDGVAGGRPRPPAPRDRRPRERFTIATYMAFKATADMEERDVADRAGTYSAEERLHRKRFAEMTPEELEETRRLLARMRWSASLRVTRRRVPDRSGPEVDLRRVLRHAGRLGAMPARLPRRRRSEKQRPVVLVADVSGSMERYSRLVLQFFHAMVRSLDDVETFVFGTRLSRITPQLRLRNVDRALEEASREVVDWAGGTRIGACLGDFNRRWGRRMLRRGAVVVVISDGCDRGDPARLAREMRHLQHRCHRLVWLNPHLGHEAYAPRVAGMRVALPFVDDFLPVDDVQALAAFSDALARLRRSGSHARPGRVTDTRRGRSATWPSRVRAV